MSLALSKTEVKQQCKDDKYIGLTSLALPIISNVTCVHPGKGWWTAKYQEQWKKVSTV